VKGMKVMNSSPFWMVWNERGSAPTHKHITIESAKAEAERLAQKNPGQSFHVLMLMGTCEVNMVRWTEPDHDEIPF
jgi:hypothetical protein